MKGENITKSPKWLGSKSIMLSYERTASWKMVLPTATQHCTRVYSAAENKEQNSNLTSYSLNAYYFCM